MNPDQLVDAVWAISRDVASLDGAFAQLEWNERLVLREASGCVLASRVPYQMAVAALQCLERKRLVPPCPLAKSERRIATALHAPLTRTHRGAYRFPSVAARRLVRLCSARRDVVDAVLDEQDVARARARLVALRCGLGPKQASLLLRNVRRDVQLAVLDIHILRFMRLAGLTTDHAAPRGLAEYEALELRLEGYACGLGMPLRHLDVAAWTVMRVL